jgi:ABC-2 type transport system ATP-binding protein
MIEVTDLVKRYGEVTVLKGISFTAASGVTGFLGPNGAGKTTTMRILTGYMPPSAGTAMVAGYDVFKNSMAVRQRVGYLPENVPLYRDMSAIGYLLYLAEIRGVANRRQKAYQVLERVGLVKRADSRIRALSKGMRQRVGLAAALLHDPQVLILDEPTIGLDPFQVLELRELVRELGRSHTVLFSTHILSEAEQVCDQVVIINRGEIMTQGAPQELRTRLSQGGRILVRAGGDPARLLAVVTATPGVSSAEYGQDGVIATPAADVDPRAALAQAILQADLALLELRPVAINLEEIFLEVTRQPQAAAVEVAPNSEEVQAS